MEPKSLWIHQNQLDNHEFINGEEGCSTKPLQPKPSHGNDGVQQKSVKMVKVEMKMEVSEGGWWWGEMVMGKWRWKTFLYLCLASPRLSPSTGSWITHCCFVDHQKTGQENGSPVCARTAGFSALLAAVNTLARCSEQHQIKWSCAFCVSEFLSVQSLLHFSAYILVPDDNILR